MISGGHLTRSKSVMPYGRNGGHGPYIYGKDGRVYLDLLCALGARSLTNSPTVRRADYGVYSFSQAVEQEAAEAVLTHVAPWASSVRFVKTGSEATHAAYRIAKQETGRPNVAFGDWAYHGWHEWSSDVAPAYRFGHENVLPEDEVGCDLAAVFVEPHRWIKSKTYAMWLRYLKDYCYRVGALLVFDEMIYGGRWALGGATEYFGVKPDLACFGKALGNGQSVACVVGNEALEKHGTMVSGTYSGDTVGLYAVMDTLEVYSTQPVIATLWARGTQLQDGLKQIIPADLGVCEGQPVHQRIRFFNEAHGPLFAKGMLKRGIAWHPACTNIMFAHTSQHMDQVIEAASDIVKELK